jgi:cell division protein FtsW
VTHVALLAPVPIAGLAAAILTSPYRLDRVRAFLDPYQDPQGIGYHLLHSLGTISGGGLLGRGLGNGVQKFGYLPEDTTDFIFAIVCEELGLLGASAVIALFGLLMWCGWAIVGRLEHPFDRLAALGITLTVGLQALLNLAVVTGLAPTKGIALPLISAGGTGWVLTAFSLGLVISLGRTQSRTAARPAKTGTPGVPTGLVASAAGRRLLQDQ